MNPKIFALFITLIFASTSCSSIFSNSAPSKGNYSNTKPLPYIDCSGRGLPITDTVFGTLQLISIANPYDPLPVEFRLLMSSIFVASAVYGFDIASDCRDYEAARINSISVNSNLGCQIDRDCKGERICVYGICQYEN